MHIGAPFYINSTADISFRAVFSDTHAIPTALWAVLRGQVAEPNASFATVPFGKELQTFSYLLVPSRTFLSFP